MRNDSSKRVLSLLLCLALFASLGLAAYADPGGAPRTGDGGAAYVLFGKINGEDYGCEGDWQNAGEYVFVNGRLTAKFALDSYVGVKLSDNSVWYMTDGWLGTEVTSAVLYDSSTLGDDADKLYVPCDIWLDFTLTENGDGSLTLRYERAYPDFSVTVAAAENGSVTADKTTARYGDTVTLTVTPAEGYSLADLYYVREGTDTHVAIPQNNGQYSFPMPESNVIVYASFAPASSHIHDGVTFTPWEATDSLPQTAGNYYLVNDVTLTDAWTVPRGVTNLCLNGRKLIQTGAGKAGFIVDNSAYLSLYDDEGLGCLSGAEDSGVKVGPAGDFQLYGGRIIDNSGAKGGGVYVAGTFTMYGGTITQNEADTLGGGVYLHDANCAVNLNGGTITGNTAGEKGGGVYVAPSCFLRVSGGPRVENNTVGGQTRNDVFLETGTLIVITRALSRSALFAVITAEAPTAEAPILLTSGMAEKGGISNFRDDTGLYELAVNEDEELELRAPQPSYIEYPLWLGEMQVTSANKDDILGDGSVSYDPESSTLRFAAAEPAITGLHDNGLTGTNQAAAQIYAEGIDLVIDAPQGLKLSTEAEKSCNIYMTGNSTLTVNGDLDFSSVYINIFSINTDYIQTGDLTIRGATFGLDVKSIKITGSVDAQSGRNVLYGMNGTAEITGDSIRVKSTDGSNTSMGIYGDTGVTLSGMLDIDTINDCVKAGYGTVTINGEATLKSSTYGISGNTVLVNGDLNMETGRHGINAAIGSGYTEIKGNVTGICTAAAASYAVVKGQNITIDGDVNAESLGYGILSENGGVITVAGGTWTLDGGRTAIYAVGGIVIPETHSIIEPAGGTVGPYSSYYVIFEADGTTVAKHVVISDQMPTVTVSFDAQGGTVDPSSLTVTAGEAIGELPVPVREDWVFLGWFTEPAANQMQAGQGTPVTAESTFIENAIVYAHWRLPGDVNGDGLVNTADVTLLAKYVKARGVGVTIVTVSGNVDGSEDGKVTTSDVALLAKYVKARGQGVVIY